MFAQVHSRALSVVLSFKTQLPFDRLPVWKHQHFGDGSDEWVNSA